MPMDRAVLVKIVGHMQTNRLPLAQPDQRRRYCSIDPDGAHFPAIDHHRLPGDCKSDVVARNRGKRFDDT